jgi:hypothetical protein
MSLLDNQRQNSLQIGNLHTVRNGHDRGQTPVMAGSDVSVRASAGQAVAGSGMRPSWDMTCTWSK